MVTAETAVVLPVLVLVLAALLQVVAAAGAQLRCVDAARLAARAAARGEGAQAVRSAALTAAPAGATLEMDHEGGMLQATVSAPASGAWWLPGLVPGVTLTASATAAAEGGSPSATS